MVVSVLNVFRFYFLTCSRTFSGTASVIGVLIKPGRIALHLTPNLQSQDKVAANNTQSAKVRVQPVYQASI